MLNYVYIINKNNSCVKIGVSNNPETRLRQLQTACDEKLCIVLKFPFKSRSQALEFEKFLHEKFKKFRLKGEWFKTKILREFWSGNADIPDFVKCKYQYKLQDEQQSHLDSI